MGSNTTSYGNEGGALVYTFTAATGAGSDSGPVAVQAKTFSKWGFCLTGAGVLSGAATAGAGGVYLFGTFDNATANGLATGANAVWFPLAAQSTEGSGDAYIWANPLTQTSTGVAQTGGAAAPAAGGGYVLYVSIPLVAVRGVILGSAPTLSAPLNLIVYAEP